MIQKRFSSKGDFVLQVEKTLTDFSMIARNDRILVAVSGGPDSVALLHVLSALSGKYSLELGIAHLNHCLRGEESDGDEAFVKSLGRKMGIPVHTRKKNIEKARSKTGTCIEETGREIRYEFFSEIASLHGYNRIALGHNRNDNAEMVLMNLIRGSGPKGLAGIPQVRGNLIRPLCHRSRQEILDYLEKIGARFRIDSTNREDVYLRNRIRHSLIPELSSYNPNIIDTLCRVSDILRMEDDWIEGIVSESMKELVIETSKDHVVISTSGIRALHRAAARRVIRRAIEMIKSDLRRISFKHIDSAIKLLEATGTAVIDLPGRIRILKSGELLSILREKKSLRSNKMSGKKLKASFDILINMPDILSCGVWIDETKTWLFFSKLPASMLPPVFEKNSKTAWMDWEKISFPLRLRNARPGDRFKPFGMNGTRKLSDFFCDAKIPHETRKIIPVIESLDHIIWIAGMRIDERVKTDSKTRFVLRAEIVKPNIIYKKNLEDIHN